jgi:hypothetical protein
MGGFTVRDLAGGMRVKSHSRTSSKTTGIRADIGSLAESREGSETKPRTLRDSFIDRWLPMEHFHLNPVRKGGQVQSQPIEELALGPVDSEVANQQR